AEKKLYNWIIEQRKQGLGVSYELACIEILNILKEPDMMILYGNSTEDFKTSNHWMSTFMKRYQLSWRKRKSFKLSNILNIDVTSVWFDMIRNFTIDQKDRMKLPPICIFKGKRLPRGEKISSSIIVWFQDNG
ncbi:8882_t:CDS:2, partial [Scutellospora calospora]